MMMRGNQPYKDLDLAGKGHWKTLQAEAEQIQEPGKSDSDVQRNNKE